MPRFVVLLKGVNVGKGRCVPMAAFKSLLESLGHEEVATLLNSGNAVFTSRTRPAVPLAQAIAQAIQATLGVDCLVIVKTEAEMASIVKGKPIPVPEGDHSKFLVAFAADAPALQSLAPLTAVAQGPDRFALTTDAAYLHCATGLLESPLGKALLGKAGQGVTTRNWATVLKLQALLQA